MERRGIWGNWLINECSVRLHSKAEQPDATFCKGKAAAFQLKLLRKTTVGGPTFCQNKGFHQNALQNWVSFNRILFRGGKSKNCNFFLMKYWNFSFWDDFLFKKFALHIATSFWLKQLSQSSQSCWWLQLRVETDDGIRYFLWPNLVRTLSRGILHLP